MSLRHRAPSPRHSRANLLACWRGADGALRSARPGPLGLGRDLRELHAPARPLAALAHVRAQPRDRPRRAALAELAVAAAQARGSAQRAPLAPRDPPPA